MRFGAESVLFDRASQLVVPIAVERDIPWCRVQRENSAPCARNEWFSHAGDSQGRFPKFSAYALSETETSCFDYVEWIPVRIGERDVIRSFLGGLLHLGSQPEESLHLTLRVG